MEFYFSKITVFFTFYSLIISDNVATSLGYSAISLQDRTHAIVNNTIFSNNSAWVGGSLIAIEFFLN